MALLLKYARSILPTPQLLVVGPRPRRRRLPPSGGYVPWDWAGFVEAENTFESRMMLPPFGGTMWRASGSSYAWPKKQEWEFVIFMSVCNSNKSVTQLQSLCMRFYNR